jgi:hypothetical protein
MPSQHHPLRAIGVERKVAGPVSGSAAVGGSPPSRPSIIPSGLASSPGFVNLSCLGRSRVKRGRRSYRGNRVLPLVRRLGTEDPERRPRDEMALKAEGIVDGGMHAQEALGRSSRLEALHFALSSSHHPMRVFGPIVPPEPMFIRAGQP